MKKRVYGATVSTESIMSVQEENILYGGPDPPIDDVKSLGEYVMNKLTNSEERVMFVSFILFF